MAYLSSGRTNTELVNKLFRHGIITTSRVRDAFLKVDRAHYTLSPANAYVDSPQSIGYGATISAPHMHAYAAEALLPFLPSSSSTISSTFPLKILDIGSGSGYLTHILAELIPDAGTVIGIDHIEELRGMAERNMRRSRRGRELLDMGKVRFVLGDGRRGWAGDGSGSGEGDGREGIRWDAIHVGAAAGCIHEELIEQLGRPGRLFIPVQDPSGNAQHIWTVDKDENGNITRKKHYGVSYVPLTDAPS